MKKALPLLCVIMAGLGALESSAQDYKPFSPACVVDSGPIFPGLTARYKYEGQWYIVGFCCTGCRTKFIQAPATYMPAALEAAKNHFAKADKKAPVDATGPCDLKKIVKSPWCVSCARDLGKDDIREGLCKKCETKPILIEYCVKAGTPEDRARISYQCASCGASSEIEAELKHEEGCTRKGGGLKKICSKSGTAPHATVAK